MRCGGPGLCSECAADAYRARAALAQPSPLQAEQAKAERPEVVAVVESNGCGEKVLAQRFPIMNVFVGDKLMTVAQHERIVEALRAENAKLSEALDRWPLIRDSLKLRLSDALARVAELEGQEPVAYRIEARDERGIVRRDCLSRTPFNEGLPDARQWAGNFTVTSTPLYAAPVAQAQHSLPEGWMLVECGIWTQEQVDEMQKTVARFRNSEFVDDRALAMAVADAGQCKAPEISLAELLAAAPGKEGGDNA